MIEINHANLDLSISRKDAVNLMEVLDSNLIGWANGVKDQPEFLNKIREDYKYKMVQQLSGIFGVNYGIDLVLERYLEKENK